MSMSKICGKWVHWALGLFFYPLISKYDNKISNSSWKDCLSILYKRQNSMAMSSLISSSPSDSSVGTVLQAFFVLLVISCFCCVGMHAATTVEETARDTGTITENEGKSKGDNEAESQSTSIGWRTGCLASCSAWYYFLPIAGGRFHRPMMTWRVIGQVVGRVSNFFYYKQKFLECFYPFST